jgi:ribosomal-protein-serine acetyltransferase
MKDKSEKEVNKIVSFKINETLTLREIQIEDAQKIFEAINTQRAYLGKWLPFVASTKSVDDTIAFVQAVRKNLMLKPEYVFSIFWENRFAGLIGFKDFDTLNRKIEIGYWLKEELQHKGIITLATNYLICFGFTKMDVNRIQIRCGTMNLSSRKIPERLGFMLEGIERDGELLSNGIYTDLAVYSLLKKEWKQSNICR